MQDQPPVTWLLSVKNALPFLPETLASIANQTYLNHKLAVWDDCSTDGTLAELHRWIPERIPGKIFEGRSLRLGPSLAFLTEQADTEFCARIDGDDLNRPGRLARQVAFLHDHPEVGVVGSQADFIDENDQPIGGWSFACDDATIRWRGNWMAHLAHSSLMFRRSTVLAAGNYRDNKCEDMELWIRVGKLTEIANLPESLIRYRRSSSSMTGRTTDFKSLFRQAAQMNADSLFPGLARDEAMKLWEAAYPDEGPAPVQLRHFRDLKRSASALARAVDKPDTYFQSTSFFAEQSYHLRRRFLEQSGLGFLRKLRRSFVEPVKKAS